MRLSENSLKFIKIINANPEKLKKMKSFSSEKEIYDYIASIIPNYTKKDFENLKDVLYNLRNRQKLSKKQESKVVGGGLFSAIDEITDSYIEGSNSANDIVGSLSIANRMLSDIIADLKRSKEKEKNKNKEENWILKRRGYLWKWKKHFVSYLEV